MFFGNVFDVLRDWSASSRRECELVLLKSRISTGYALLVDVKCGLTLVTLGYFLVIVIIYSIEVCAHVIMNAVVIKSILMIIFNRLVIMKMFNWLFSLWVDFFDDSLIEYLSLFKFFSHT